MVKVFMYSAIGAVLVVTGSYAVSNIYAEEATVLTQVQAQHIAERIAERAEIVIQAMDEGKLTERQAEILDAMEDLKPMGGRGMFGAGKGLSEEERAQLREEVREQQEGSMLEKLNEEGLEVTHEELEELRALREDLGLMGNQHRRSGSNGGQGTGECPNL